MSVLLVVVLSVLVFFSIAMLRRNTSHVVDNEMTSLSENDLLQSVKEMLRNSEVLPGGRGIDPTVLLPTITRAHRIIAKKVKKNMPLCDGERWFYENYYLVYRYAYAKKDSLSSLPHIGDYPRVVAWSKKIVNGSLSGITSDRVRIVLDGINFGNNFTYAELNAFENAFKYAITEQIYVLAKRFLHQERNRKLAYRRYFNEKLIGSPTYVHTLFKSGCLSKEALDKLHRRGLDKESALLEYNNVLFKNATMARTLFSAMREAGEFLPAQVGFSYLSAERVLNENGTLKNVSVPTKREYFSAVEKIAKKCRYTEEYCAKMVKRFSLSHDIDLSTALFDHKREIVRYIKSGKERPLKKTRSVLFQWAYVSSLFLFSALLSAGIAVLFDIVSGILSFLPTFFLVQNVQNYLLSHVAPQRMVPKNDYKTIPYEHRVAIVVSEFVSSMEQFQESLRHARRIYAGNGGENAEVILLLDTAGGKEPVSDLDREIVKYLNTVSAPILVFLRKKVLIDGKYGGFERKRGAILALNKYFMTGDKSAFYHVHGQPFIPEYVLTLDADNELLCGESLELVNMMSHPYNKRYDLLSCHSRYNLFSIKTPFSERFLSESGCETYPTFSGLFYRLFQRDIYCGKGIYRLKNFYNATEDVFPSKKILSHDVLEGSVLLTGAGTTVFEDAPQSFLSDRERKKRWIRGDIQLLPFLRGRWKNDENVKCRTKIEPLNKFIMINNVLSTQKELFLTAMFLYGLFAGFAPLFVAAGVFLAPYIVNIIKLLRGLFSGDLLRSTIKDGANILLNCIEDFFLLPYYAVGNLLLTLHTFFRMVAQKNLLVWKTFYDSQKIHDYSSLVREFTSTFLFLTAVTAVFCTFRPFVGVIIGAFSIIFPLITIELHLSGQKFIEEPGDGVDRLAIRRYAEKTYKFFSYCDSFGYIVPDNLQIKPYKGLSSHTSPTDIGFSILAKICAKELGFIDYEECSYALKKIIDEVEKLPKWHGNLYNWYSVTEKKPLNEFVSSVDNGNFLAALFVAKSFFASYNDVVGQMRVELLIKQCDLRTLFDDNKDLFYLGYDGKKYVGHYDLYNSESRLLSILYIALYKNNEHFYSLQRDFTVISGKNTLLSWSGTAFETLLPELFIRTPKHSLTSDTAKHTVKRQMKKRYNGVWGVSESGYYRFDNEKKYQYYAFGLQELALRSEVDQPVISPYASILALSYDDKNVIKNLSLLEEIGAVGEYGFYEAVDFKNGKNIVSSFMSHHQGMALVSMTNYLCDNCIKKYFENDEEILSVLLYLNETTTKVRYSIKTNENRRIQAIKEKSYSKNCTKIEQSVTTFALTDGDYSVFYNANGNNFVIDKLKNITVFRKDYFGLDGAYFIVFDGDDLFSPTYLPFENADDKQYLSAETNGKEIRFCNGRKNCEMEFTLLDGLSASVWKLRSRENNRIFFHSSVCLNKREDFESHPTYNGLFTDAYVKEDVLFLRRRDTAKKEDDFFLAVRVFGLKNVRYECNDMNFIGKNNTLKTAKIYQKYTETAVFDPSDFITGFKNPSFPSLGDVLYPCVGFTGVLLDDECQVVAMSGKEETVLFDRIRCLPEDPYSYALMAVDRTILQEKTHDVLGAFLYKPYENDLLQRVLSRSDREAFLTVTHGKKLLVYTFSKDDFKHFEDFLRIVCDLKTLSIDFSCGILFPEDVDKNVVEHVKKMLLDFSVTDSSFFYRKEEAEKYAFYIFSGDLATKPVSAKSLRYFLENEQYLLENDIDLPKNELFISGNGGFDNNDCYVYHVENTRGKPYSNVASGRRGGYVLTDNGSGFFFFKNSRENKISRFDNDPLTKYPSEKLEIIIHGKRYRINDGNGKSGYAVFDRGRTTYFRRVFDMNTRADFNLIQDGAARVCTVSVRNCAGQEYVFQYSFLPCLDWTWDPDFISWRYDNGIISIENVKNGRKIYCKILTDDLSFVTPQETFYPSFTLAPKEIREINFSIVFSEDFSIISSVNRENLSYAISAQKEMFSRYYSPETTAPERSFTLLTRYLPYQIVSSRLFGKTGFYQVSGATGFRDQLQDAVALLHADPTLCREQIIDCCLHQYKEGDVMHWWHAPKFGLRSKISDDKLFLPIACAEYARFTGETELLEEKLPYLSSPILRHDEDSRYEDPPYTDETFPIKDHCLAAIKSALRFGSHGLVCMGAGDWNDGMDFIGKEGVGESVFTTMLLYEALTKFSPFCEEKTKNELLRIAEDLKTSLDHHAFEIDRYKRLFTDDNRWLGSKSSPTLTLDLLVQSYAVISGVCDRERAEIILNTAKELIDKEGGLIRLLDPPQDRTDYLGYLSAYPAGVRENGGQYTHAAMWYLIALTKIGRQDEAYDLFQMLNPVEKCRNERKNAMYMAEPYVLCGDVYSNEQNYGQAGWSWYTGSAGWAYRLIYEEFFGLIRQGNSLIISPHLPKKLDGAIVHYTYLNSLYIIEYRIDSAPVVKENERRECRTVVLNKNVREKISVTVSPRA